MPNLQASEAAYRNQQKVTGATLTAARREWARMDPNQLDRSFRAFLGRFLPVLVAGQRASARLGAAYVEAALLEQGLDPDLVGRVNADAVGGQASDGRPLDTLLYSPVVGAKRAIGQGVPPESAVTRSRFRLDRIVATQLADAGRGGQQVQMGNSRTVTGYVRMLNPPSCPQCAVLAGRWYRTNEGFARHGNCDCVHVPSSRQELAAPYLTDPGEYFRSLPRDQQDTIFGAGSAEAIRRGADMGRVVNAQRGMSRPAALMTTELKKFARRPGGRLSPDGVFRIARSDGEVVDLLRANGYLF